MSEFYVGYLPKASERLGRTLPRIVLALTAVALGLGLLLVFAQQPFPASRFEYLQDREYQGVIVSAPYPALLAPQGRFLLVAPGKHGAGSLVAGLDLHRVQLRGALIQRGDDRMLELVPGSIRATSQGRATHEPAADLGLVTLSGEIVDSKCYLGVMNPGNGKVHRDCAVRCISGGIPPAFLVRDSAGQFRTLLLAGPGGRALSRELLDYVAEPVRISGKLTRSAAGMLTLEAEPGSWPDLVRRE